MRLPDDPVALPGALVPLHEGPPPPLTDPVAAATWWLAGTLTGAHPDASVPNGLGAATPLADPLQAPDPLQALALLTALASRDDLGPAWADRVDDAIADAQGRPDAWRHLSEHALLLEEALEPGGRAAELLAAVREAALVAPTPDALAAATAVVRRARRASWLASWRAWAQEHAATFGRALDDALGRLETAPLAAAAADDPALVRTLLAEAADGEVTLALLPGGLRLEWTGDGPLPDAALDGNRLPDAPPGEAERAWHLADPPPAGAVLTLSRGAHRWTVPLP